MAEHRILITGPFSPAATTRLEERGFIVIRSPANASIGELMDALAVAEGYVLGGNEKVTSGLLDRAEKLRMIVFLGEQPETFMESGVRALLEERGIPLETTEALSTNAVAELTCGLILAALRRIPFLVRAVQDGEWLDYTGEELAGKTLGICGMGRIGYSLVKRLLGFDLRRVLYYDLVRVEKAEEDFGAQRVQLDDLLGNSDIVSIHTPLGAETEGMIGERQLHRMKRTAVLVNAARPRVVDPYALRKALEERWIACAAFDGYYLEGMEFVERARQDDPYGLLYMRDRFFVTSHQGFNTQTAVRQLSDRAVEKIIRFFAESRSQAFAA